MVYGNLMMKWQLLSAGSLPESFLRKFSFLLRMFINAWVVSSLVAVFLASLFWMAALAKFDLSHAYPFMGLTFVLVLVLSVVLFHEPLTMHKIIGIVLIVTGIIVGSRG
jgi:multidrug transporter EmrE-like cation transporter